MVAASGRAGASDCANPTRPNARATIGCGGRLRGKPGDAGSRKATPLTLGGRGSRFPPLGRADGAAAAADGGSDE
jgi:hypothetical protein